MKEEKEIVENQDYKMTYKMIIRSCVANSSFSHILKKSIYEYLNELERMANEYQKMKKDNNNE